MRIGDTFEMRLGGLGSAGYLWELSVAGDEDIVRTSLTTEPPLPPSGDRPPGSFSVDEIFSAEALKKGKAEICLVLRRPWEHGVPPVRAIILEVSVSV